MKNKLSLVFAIVGGLIVVAGLFYYLGHGNSSGASSSGTLSRDEASSLILAYMKQNPAEGSIATNYGFTCPNYNSSLSVANDLAGEGYVSKTSSDTGLAGEYDYALTAKATPYILDTPTPADGDIIAVLVAQTTNVAVTGITATGQDTDQADFTAAQQLTPFGVACSYPTSEDSSANLQLYDSGWRVVGN